MLPAPLSKSKRADFVLQGVARYLANSRSPISLLNVFHRDPTTLDILLEVLSLGTIATETITNDPEAFEIVRLTQGRPIDRKWLIDDIMTEVGAISDNGQAIQALARHNRREMLRVAYGQFIKSESTRNSFGELSNIAEAILRTAFEKTWNEVKNKCGTPMHPTGRKARCGILAFNDLGGWQQTYAPKIKLMFVAETDGRTDANRIIANTDFFERLAFHFLEWFPTGTTTHSTYDIEIVRPPI